MKKSKPIERCGEVENSRICTRKKDHTKPHRWELFNRCGQIENGKQCLLDADWHAHQPCWFADDPLSTDEEGSPVGERVSEEGID